MNEMEARVAKAIQQADAPTVAWDDVRDQALYGTLARAAIASMHEPTKHMILAAWRLGATRQHAVWTWPTMIEAALKDEL